MIRRRSLGLSLEEKVSLGSWMKEEWGGEEKTGS